jgi:hypothetical protein
MFAALNAPMASQRGKAVVRAGLEKGLATLVLTC